MQSIKLPTYWQNVQSLVRALEWKKSSNCSAFCFIVSPSSFYRKPSQLNFHSNITENVSRCMNILKYVNSENEKFSMITLNIKKLYAKLFLDSASYQTSWKVWRNKFSGEIWLKTSTRKIPRIIPSEWNCMLNERRIKNSLWTFIVWRWILKSSLSSGRAKKREKNFVNEANWNGRNWKIWTKHENSMMRVGCKKASEEGNKKIH